MPEYRRLLIPGGTYFFTVNLADRRSSLLVKHIEKLRAAWAETAKSHPFETVAVVILPDHLHTVWTLPENDGDFRTRWRLIKGGFSRRVRLRGEASPRRTGERNVWQRRFWEHVVRDADELAAYTNYIHWNPVKHGHVTDLERYHAGGILHLRRREVALWVRRETG
ncbi:MAG: transposase, partial [Pseudomonadota bacterium]